MRAAHCPRINKGKEANFGVQPAVPSVADGVSRLWKGDSEAGSGLFDRPDAGPTVEFVVIEPSDGSGAA